MLCRAHRDVHPRGPLIAQGADGPLRFAFRHRIGRAVEPVIGHLKEHHRMGRNQRAHRAGDASNAVLAAAGYNFRRLLARFRLLLRLVLGSFYRPLINQSA